jgi:hypothetical protein
LFAFVVKNRRNLLQYFQLVWYFCFSGITERTPPFGSSTSPL